jgi:anti-sigma28 factor (negative regulator of flagellin synthesis)
MRIDPLNRPPVTQGAEKPDQSVPEPALERSANAATDLDRVEVSRLAQALPTRDPQRLEQLRLDAQSGKYDASAEAVAKAIIEAHLKE